MEKILFILFSRELYWGFGVENMLVTNVPRIPGHHLFLLLEGKGDTERGIWLGQATQWHEGRF